MEWLAWSLVERGPRGWISLLSQVSNPPSAVRHLHSVHLYWLKRQVQNRLWCSGSPHLCTQEWRLVIHSGFETHGEGHTKYTIRGPTKWILLQHKLKSLHKFSPQYSRNILIDSPTCFSNLNVLAVQVNKTVTVSTKTFGGLSRSRVSVLDLL